MEEHEHDLHAHEEVKLGTTHRPTQWVGSVRGNGEVGGQLGELWHHDEGKR